MLTVFDSQTGVTITDKSDIIQALEQQGIDAADYADQEGANSVFEGVPTYWLE